jgi:hypothetical protein
MCPAGCSVPLSAPNESTVSGTVQWFFSQTLSVGDAPARCAWRSITDVKRRKAPSEEGAFLVLHVLFALKGVRRCPTLPQGPPCSTIGAESLSFRVRNVTGRFPLAMAAETFTTHHFWW